MRATIEPMIAGGGGSIVNISSVEGLAGSAHLHSYVAAKFGLPGITKSAAVELAQYNIRVNSIHPGLVHTPLSAGVTEEFMRPIPLRRGAARGGTFVLCLVSDGRPTRPGGVRRRRRADQLRAHQNLISSADPPIRRRTGR